MTTTNLHVAHYGRGETELVLLHGWGLNGLIWQPLIPWLEANYRIHVIDLPGMGGSAHCTVDYAPSPLVNALLAVAPQSAIWVGWSLGGLLALQVAATAAARVQGLVMVASSPRFLTDALWPGLSEATLANFAVGLTQNPQAFLQDFLACHLRATQTPSQQRALAQAILAVSVPTPQTLHAALRVLVEWDLRANLRRLHCAHLHILGERDGLVPHALAATLAREFSPAQVQVMPRAAHVPFLTDSDLFCRWLNTFAAVSA